MPKFTEEQIKEREEKVLNNTISGGVTINDVIWHIGQEDLPFGGVGPSGIGTVSYTHLTLPTKRIV